MTAYKIGQKSARITRTQKAMTPAERAGMNDMLKRLRDLRQQAVTPRRKPMHEYRFEAQGGDLIIVAPDMTADKYREIIATLTADKAKRVIGWKQVGR